MAKSIAGRLGRGLAYVVGVVVVLLAVLWLSLKHPRPTGTPGPEADQLAHAIERAVDADAWARTGAVRFTFRKFHHLWDRRRNLDRVSWDRNQVLLDIGARDGRAFRDGQPVTGELARKLLDKAYASWVNDSFWLNPLAKLFDDGVSRSIIDDGGKPALLVEYGRGGLTPGDSYLWRLDDEHRPRAWRLWVSILPVKGLEFSWEGWTTLATGAKVSTVHRALGLDAVPIREVAGAASLAELEPGPDPFQ